MPIFVPLIWDFNAVDFVLLKNGNISIFQFILQKICASHGVPININVQGGPFSLLPDFNFISFFYSLIQTYLFAPVKPL